MQFYVPRGKKASVHRARLVIRLDLMSRQVIVVCLWECE